MLEFINITNFYETTKQVGLLDLVDLLFKRYSNIEYLFNLQADDGLLIILKAIEASQKEQMYEKWLHDQARYEMSFDDYYKKHIPYKPSTKEEKEDILNKYGG